MEVRRIEKKCGLVKVDVWVKNWGLDEFETGDFENWEMDLKRSMIKVIGKMFDC